MTEPGGFGKVVSSVFYQNQIYTVRYEAVNAMMLNEFLKEHRKVAEQKTEIDALKQSVAELKRLVQTIVEKQ